MNLPTLTVLIPCFNSAIFLARAIDSVLAQTWKDFEILVIDDGSTDNSLQVIEQYSVNKPCIRLIRHNQNRGLPAARNTGIQHAQGRLIAFLDADDWWSPEKLAVQIPAFDNPDIGACCMSSILVYPDRQILQKSQAAFINSDTLYQTLLFRNAIPGSASSMVVRKEYLETCGLFDESMVAAEDHDMWIRLAQHYIIQWIDSPLVYIDKSHPGSMTKTANLMAKGREQFLDNRKSDVSPECRNLLSSARRYAQIQSAIDYLRVDDSAGARLCARKAIFASPKLDRELRRAIFLFCLSCIPLPFQRRFLRPLRKRWLKNDETISASSH